MRPTYDELHERLVRAEGMIEALRRGEVDMVIGLDTPRLVRPKSLVEGNERLLQAIEQAEDVVVITSGDGAIQYVNPAFEVVTGFARSEALGQNPRILKSGKQDVSFYRELWETLNRGRSWKGQMVNRRKDDAEFTVEASISPVKDGDGRTVHFVAVYKDITEQLRVREQNIRLEEQLLQSQKLESVGLLAGGVAHDFNNLLSVILLHGESVLRQLHPEEVIRADIEEMVEAGQRAAALTRQLLAFSRKQTLQPKVVDLNELLRNFERMLGRLIGEDVLLELQLVQGLGKVVVDPWQIEQVVMNLAINAREAMPQGGRLVIETGEVRLEENFVRANPGTKPGNHVVLSVSDTGCGMSDELVAQIFDPFFSTKEKGRGTGLGLSTVYGIIKQSGGTICVESEPGRGSTFKIYLPQTEGEAVEGLKKRAVGKFDKGTEAILVVEDEDRLRRLITRFLARLGYQVTTAANGSEAVVLVEEKGLNPDLIITDVVMPKMSGKQMVDRLRQKRPHLKVLYMSGYTNDAIANHGVLEPGTPFIEKPFSIDSMAESVRELLQGGEARDESVS